MESQTRTRALCFTNDYQENVLTSITRDLYPISLMYLPLYMYEIIQSNHACVITDKQGIILFVNNAWEELCGYSISSVYMKSFSLLQGEKTDYTIIREFMNELMKKGYSSMNIVNYNNNNEELNLSIESERIYPTIDTCCDEGNKCYYFTKVR